MMSYPNADLYEALDIEVCDAAMLNNFLLVHNFNDEENVNGYYKICGHVHPAVRLRGKGKQGITLPCFYFGLNFGSYRVLEVSPENT